MIAGPIFLAVALAVPARPPCNPDPTLTPQPTLVNCSADRLGQIHGDWRCDMAPGGPEGSRKYVWVWVARPKPSSEGLGPANVCEHQDGYTWRCPAGPRGSHFPPCDWHLSERTEVR